MSKGIRLADLPAAAREQATRAVSRELGKGNGPTVSPELKQVQTAKPSVAPTATWHKAAACYARVVPVQVVNVTPHKLTILDHVGAPVEALRHDTRVRYFADEGEAYAWVDATYTAKIERLTIERTTLRNRPTQTQDHAATKD